MRIRRYKVTLAKCAKTQLISHKALLCTEVEAISNSAPIVFVFYIKDYGQSQSLLKYPEHFEETVRDIKIKYNLRAVISHQGPNRTSGHFRTFIKSSNRIWYLVIYSSD